MKIENLKTEKLKEYNHNLLEYVEANYSQVKTLYLDLGVKVVRLLCYSKEFIPHIEKQLTFTLSKSAKQFDATIILWQEKNITQIIKYIAPEFSRTNDLQKGKEKFLSEQSYDEDLWIFDRNYSASKPLLSVDIQNRIVNSYNKETETYFYGVENLEPEEFIKQGHIFVQILNNILKTENTNLVHGACVGLNDKGVLFCARGQRGKSTLAVLAMMKGFEYVSDDYLTLEKENNNLYAHPIYSIITLSPRMYNELYDRLDGCRFISNNARKDKYVINISRFHNRFRKRYPVTLCMFPEIVSDSEPSIEECNVQEKGRAITHLIHSTILQMNDRSDIKTVRKLTDMVKDLKFYKINLCDNIEKNAEFLEDFMRKYKNG